MRVVWHALMGFVVLGSVPGCSGGGSDEDVDRGGTPNEDGDREDGKGDSSEPQPTTAMLQSVAGGKFKAIAPYSGLGGSALMVRHLDGETDLSLAIVGVTASTMFTAHLHAAPCEYNGGGHYKIDPLIADALESNELWLTGQSSDTGSLIAEASFPHLTRGEALSIVVHDPMGGAKMACADLREDDSSILEFSGTVAPFAAATEADMTLAGTITARRSATATGFTLELSGLDPEALGYATHVHAEPCEVATGAGHYKLNPTVLDTVEANEIWLPLTPTTPGSATSKLNVKHAIRSDAQSVVVHRAITEVNKPKVACANLERKTARVPLETSGTAINLPAAGGALTGAVVMTRKLSGVTDVAVVVSGLEPGMTYDAHVHNQPCAFGDGGGHYKIDNTVSEALEDNEIWFELAADSKGAAHDSKWLAAIASAAAQSVVVHAEGGARLACFDLK